MTHTNVMTKGDNHSRYKIKMTGDRSDEQRVHFNSPLTILPPTTDPLYNFISSERYVDSLENKLNRLKDKNVKEPNSKDILISLKKVRDSQMEQLMQGASSSNIRVPNEDYEGSVLKKDYTGKQQSKEEIVALLHHDELAKITSENEDDDKGHLRTDSKLTS